MTTRFDHLPTWLTRLGGHVTAAATALACTLGTALAQSDEPPAEVTGEPTQSGRGGQGLDLGFDLNVADNLYLIWIAGALVAAVVGALFHYRAQLESFIRRGVHPDRFGWSVYIAWFGVFLLLAFFALANADAGVHLALLVAFIVICLAGFLAGRLLWQFALFVLLAMCVAGLYRYWAQVA
jgi:hypothetical protein